jgi:DnaJ-domain-containing protein 1|tara:strand:- start:2895 stop:3626 length:732 start_codon:yes stop_codon:yes gene_type:complete
MSKQLKLKFKKTLKKAEFVHADLEYHQQLISEAKSLFSDEIRRLLSLLSDDEREALEKEDKRRIETSIKIQEAAAQRRENLKQIEEEITSKILTSDCTALTVTDLIAEECDPEELKEKTKLIELKKLFYRIASETHPDKVRANGFSEKEIYRLEKIFKRALSAYESNNWYILYSIAHELNLKIDEPTEYYIDWVETDIRNTLGEISKIGTLVAWIWYVGDEGRKKLAIQDYFRQMYSFTYPGL